MAKNIVTQIYELLNTCIDVTALRDCLDDLIAEGYGDAMVGFRIGRTSMGMALSFPVASFRIDPDKKFLMLVPIPDRLEDGEVTRDFDTIVDFKEETIEVSIVDYTEKETQDNVQ